MKIVQIIYFSTVVIGHLLMFNVTIQSWYSMNRIASTIFFIYSVPVYAILMLGGGAMVLVVMMIIGIGVESVITGRNVYKEYL